MGCSKNSSKREVYSNAILPHETRKTSSRQPNLHLKQLQKEGKKILQKQRNHKNLSTNN